MAVRRRTSRIGLFPSFFKKKGKITERLRKKLRIYGLESFLKKVGTLRDFLRMYRVAEVRSRFFFGKMQFFTERFPKKPE